MNDLLEAVTTAHGGSDRWNAVRSVDVTFNFDIDQKLAANQRERAFSVAAKNGYLVAFAHTYFPGVGHVGKDGNHYRWIPVPYTNDATKY
jgi:hypothetical protein